MPLGMSPGCDVRTAPGYNQGLHPDYPGRNLSNGLAGVCLDPDAGIGSNSPAVGGRSADCLLGHLLKLAREIPGGGGGRAPAGGATHRAGFLRPAGTRLEESAGEDVDIATRSSRGFPL